MGRPRDRGDKSLEPATAEAAAAATEDGGGGDDDVGTGGDDATGIFCGEDEDEAETPPSTAIGEDEPVTIPSEDGEAVDAAAAAATTDGGMGTSETARNPKPDREMALAIAENHRSRSPMELAANNKECFAD